MGSVLLVAALSAAALSAAGLESIKSVYILRMAGGLDQHLANRLTVEGAFEIVTDPKRADAVFTDQLGPGFEDKLAELYPKETPEELETKKKAQESGKIGEIIRPKSSSFHRGKGNVFLVDLQSRRVVWSTYERPKDMSPDELAKTSQRIVTQLKKDRQPRNPGAP
jgi:hypothetical protein